MTRARTIYRIAFAVMLIALPACHRFLPVVSVAHGPGPVSHAPLDLLCASGFFAPHDGACSACGVGGQACARCRGTADGVEEMPPEDDFVMPARFHPVPTAPVFLPRPALWPESPRQFGPDEFGPATVPVPELIPEPDLLPEPLETPEDSAWRDGQPRQADVGTRISDGWGRPDGIDLKGPALRLGERPSAAGE